MREREPQADPYWNHQADLGLVYYGRAHRPLRLRSHTETERFRGVGGADLFRVSVGDGTRHYVQSRLFIPDNGIHRDIRLADAQAWHYPADRTIVLWELLLEPHVAVEDPRESLLLRTLWLRYEKYLAERFPDADTLLTTWEDTYEREQWEGFLAAAGYRKTEPAVFAKKPYQQGGKHR